MKKAVIACLFVMSILFSACKTEPIATTYHYDLNPQFTWGYAQFYGDYYRNYNIKNNVLSLNLFTKNLFINSDKALDGTGQYLLMEDIFVAPNDTLLPAGTYKVSETAEPFTFYSGKIFKDKNDEIPSGAYIYFIESDAARSKIACITDGTMTISIQNDTIYNIACHFVLDGKDELNGTFSKVLYHFDEHASTPASVKRNTLKIKRFPF